MTDRVRCPNCGCGFDPIRESCPSCGADKPWQRGPVAVATALGWVVIALMGCWALA